MIIAFIYRSGGSLGRAVEVTLAEDGRTLGYSERTSVTEAIAASLSMAGIPAHTVQEIARDYTYQIRDPRSFIRTLLFNYVSSSDGPVSWSMRSTADVIEAARALGVDLPEFAIIERSIYGDPPIGRIL